MTAIILFEEDTALIGTGPFSINRGCFILFSYALADLYLINSTVGFERRRPSQTFASNSSKRAFPKKSDISIIVT